MFENVTGYSLYHDINANNGRREADATSSRVFASDRVWLTKQFSVLGGVRWDDYKRQLRLPLQRRLYGHDDNADRRALQRVAPNSKANTQFWSPKASLIWEPTEQQTYYVSWAKSFTPPGTFVSNEVNAIGILPGQSALDPEVSETWEAGAKYSLLDGQARPDRRPCSRSRRTMPAYNELDRATSVPSGEVQRVRGVELGVSGQVTNAWFVQASYAYLDSEILDGRRCVQNRRLQVHAVVVQRKLATSTRPIYDPIHYRQQGAAGSRERLQSLDDLRRVVAVLHRSRKATVGGGITYVGRLLHEPGQQQRDPQSAAPSTASSPTRSRSGSSLSTATT